MATLLLPSYSLGNVSDIFRNNLSIFKFISFGPMGQTAPAAEEPLKSGLRTV